MNEAARRPTTAPRAEVWPGQPLPLGATFDGFGTCFSVFSEVAEAVELCLFDDDGTERPIVLPEVTAFIHHGYLPGVGPGQRYGYRVHGPWRPSAGLRCNPHKLLIDPYARSVEGQVDWHPSVFGYDLDAGPDVMGKLDSAPHMPRSVVTSPYFEWTDDRHPRTPLHETVIYELHVKGFTELNPMVPEHLRGTYAALAQPEVIDYLQDLGVTAVELLPVHQFVHDHFLYERGLRNYWGYNSIAFLAPHNEYASYGRRTEQVQDFKQMVKTLHRAGIEVILDVVYNHTAEGNHLGPHLSLRGIDNAAYYRLSPEDPRRYIDYTGTGNSLNMRHPHVLQLIMDSLRYWVQEMHVDGFRFDLAATLARELHDVDRLSAFFDLIQQDPVISQTKLIAEPWDVGEGGYQVGNFPPLWSEWNGKYRDAVRDYWRGSPATLGDLASRFTGSSDLYASNGRAPAASINFVTAHDGFTLRDLVSYDDKHNEANGDANTDGESDNRSWNCGVEGPTDDPIVNQLRSRQQRNLLTTLMLSQGVPMLLAGDELGRTQWGNNNAYCHDSALSWLDWDDVDEELLAFTQELIAFRRAHPVFRRRRFFEGRRIQVAGATDVGWFTPRGTTMSDSDWQQGFAHSLAVFLNGEAIPTVGPRGERIVDDSFFVLFNASERRVAFTLPAGPWADRWARVIDTAGPGFVDRSAKASVSVGGRVTVAARSVTVLQSLTPPREPEIP